MTLLALVLLTYILTTQPYDLADHPDLTTIGNLKIRHNMYYFYNCNASTSIVFRRHYDFT